MFLVADTHLYKRLCPSVGPLVRPLVRPSVRSSVCPLLRPSGRHKRVEFLRNGLNLNKIASGTWIYAIKKTIQVCQNASDVWTLPDLFSSLFSQPLLWIGHRRLCFLERDCHPTHFRRKFVRKMMKALSQERLVKPLALRLLPVAFNYISLPFRIQFKIDSQYPST